MEPSGTLRAALLPLLLLASGTVERCEISTASGTGELRIVGTIRFVEREGGCWRLDANDGRRYELRADQAPDAVLRDGARVRLLVRERVADAGRCGLGTPVDVRKVEAVETA